MTLRLTFLGTGTSQGVPMIACPCEVCRSADPRDRRLRTSALIRVEFGGDSEGGGAVDGGSEPESTREVNLKQPLNIVIDAGPDFRTQMLAAGVVKLDAILLTHEHKDHTGGIDDVRAYNYFGQAPIDIWATERVQRALRHDYAYAFDEHPYPGAPEITLHTIDEGPFRVVGRNYSAPSWPPAGWNPAPDVPDSAKPPLKAPSGGAVFTGEVPDVEVTPIHGMHMRLPVTGFRIGKLAYLTDFNHIEEAEVEKLRGVEVLVVNALGHREHISHFNLAQAIELSRRVGAQCTYLTHTAHRMGLYAEVEPTLPEGVHLAYDGLTVTI